MNYLIVFIFNAQSKNKQWVWHEPNTILRSHALLFHISSQISLFAFSIEDNLMKFYMLVLIKIKKHFLRCSHVNWKIDFYLNKSLSATMQTSCVPYWAKYFFSVMFFFLLCCSESDQYIFSYVKHRETIGGGQMRRNIASSLKFIEWCYSKRLPICRLPTQSWSRSSRIFLPISFFLHKHTPSAAVVSLEHFDLWDLCDSITLPLCY